MNTVILKAALGLLSLLDYQAYTNRRKLERCVKELRTLNNSK